MMNIYASNDYVVLHPLATAPWLSKQSTYICISPCNHSARHSRPRAPRIDHLPQPFLSPPKRIGPPPACLSGPYSSLQSLHFTPATRDLLPLRASHAQGPMTGRKESTRRSLTAVAT